jgi:hypothetical protein
MKRYIFTWILVLHDLLFGGAWTRKAGEILLIPHYYFYQAENYYDINWKTKGFDNRGYFDSNRFGLYFEYGLTDRLNLIGNWAFISNRWIDDFDYKSNSGVGDIELSLKFKIFEASVISSIQFIALIPTYSVDSEPILGFGKYAGEVRFLFSGGIKLFSLDSYFNLETGYRKFQKDVASQIRFQILYGIYLNKNLQGIVQLDGVHSIGVGSFATKFNPSIETDYVEGKLSVSIAYKLTHKTWANFGFYHNLYGKKIGVGKGFFIGAWIVI